MIERFFVALFGWNIKKKATLLKLLFFILILLFSLIKIDKKSYTINYANAQVTPPTPTGTCELRTNIPIGVLSLAYYPPDPTRPDYLDPEETGWGGNNYGNMTIADWEVSTQRQLTDGLEYVSNATRYHGYKVPNAPRFLAYYVVDFIKFYEKIPPRVPNCTDPISCHPHYRQILDRVNICNYVDNMNVKEVWMYGYHSSHIAPDESKMSSRYGDIANDWPKDDFIPEAYRMPRCNNSYTLYNFAYNPGGSVGNDAHNRMHQIENVIFFAENRGYPVSAANYRGSIFNDDFSEWFDIFPPNRESFRSSCGNTHFTPNWTSLSNEYNYWLTNYREFNCETWHPDDSRTTYINANCERWGCTPLGFYQWFMQNMPGFQNGIEYQGQTMKNWWEAFYDFNAFIDNGHSLYGSSIFACPTPTLTPSPILQLTSGWNRITWPNINGKITSDLPTVCPIMVNYYNGKTSIFVRNYGSTSVNFIPGDIYFLNCSSPTVWQL